MPSFPVTLLLYYNTTTLPHMRRLLVYQFVPLQPFPKLGNVWDLGRYACARASAHDRPRLQPCAGVFYGTWFEGQIGRLALHFLGQALGVSMTAMPFSFAPAGRFNRQTTACVGQPPITVRHVQPLPLHLLLPTFSPSPHASKRLPYSNTCFTYSYIPRTVRLSGRKV